MLIMTFAGEFLIIGTLCEDPDISFQLTGCEASVQPVFRPTEFSSVFVQRLPSNFDFGLDKIPTKKCDNS